MGFNVSTLTDYTKQNVELLVTKSLYGASKTKRLIQAEGNVQTGIKSSETINRISSDVIFQNGGTCGFNSSGDTAITQRTITVGKIKVNEALCHKTLESKFTQNALKQGSRQDAVPFEEEITTLKADGIAEALEKASWQGDTTSDDVNLNKYDGFLKIIDATGAAVSANQAPYIAGGAISAGTGITSSNVRSIISAMWKALPARLKGKKDIRIFCGYDTFDTFISSYTDANLFNFAPKGTELEEGEVVIPGTTYRLTAVNGLDGTNRLIAARMSNLYEGTDMENEEEKWEIFFAKEADEVRFIAEFKEGVQVAFPDEIVSFKLAA